MQIEIKIDSNCKEPRIIVITDKVTEEINELVRQLSENTPQVIAGFLEDMVEILNPEEIINVYASSGKVYAKTENDEYLLRMRLYEIEERLSKRGFVRISNSEIINLNKVKSFDLSFVGTICVTLSDGTVTYVSRRYVSKIKQVLGI
ncbi:MAG: LytTR family transcriptional regulator [Ruminococcaceae bacterium]|nr:LytTR family transcriptional regulator [Oscillospiraceae bacterium]